MSIDAVLQQLLRMMQSAGVPIPDDFDSTDGIVIENPDPATVYAEFKDFAQMTFDCSYFNTKSYFNAENDTKCVELKDEFIFYSFSYIAGFRNPSFNFGFRRIFKITYESENEELSYSEIIRFELEYDPIDELVAFVTPNLIEDFIVPPYNEPPGLNEFFADIEALDVYRLVMNKYRPKLLIIDSYGD